VSIQDAFEVLRYAALLLLFGFVAWSLVAHRRRFSSAFAWARPYRRTVRVPVDWERAHELCHRALREALGTRTSKRDQRGEFTARVGARRRSYLHQLRFRLRRDTPSATVICVESTSTGHIGAALPYPAATADRRSQVDELVEWLDQYQGHEG
jgi:hypothetical protein